MSEVRCENCDTVLPRPHAFHRCSVRAWSRDDAIPEEYLEIIGRTLRLGRGDTA